jgi:hypothetical protein
MRLVVISEMGREATRVDIEPQRGGYEKEDLTKAEEMLKSRDGGRNEF